MVSGAETVIVAVGNLAMRTITAVSEFAPLPMSMVWPLLKPWPLATGISVAPAEVSALTVVAPDVPTVAISAVSRFAPAPIRIVRTESKPSTLATLMFVVPACEANDNLVEGEVAKSVQLLPVSAPSGNRPALVLAVLARRKLPEAADLAWRSHVASTSSCS